MPEQKKIHHFITDIIESDLAAGRVDTIQTRFPPEPNGYLHIGSAKAIWINYTAAKQYGGKFNLRYDDTNPVKEDDEYVRAIEEDVRWLGATPDAILFGSDYFDQCYQYAEQLIEKGLAFVCDLTQEEMSQTRGTHTTPGTESPYKSRSIEENLDLFRRMKAGEFADGAQTLRAKIDMASPNFSLRDPVIYRILHASHHRQGDKWCIYPMYDFAHPLQDAIENVTHSCCTLEFDNNRALYDWFLDSLDFKPRPTGDGRPYQYEFAKLAISHTVMGKRHLIKMVKNGLVDGWDDPRMPTLSGLRRRGVTPTAIFDFIERSGVSKAISMADIALFDYCVTEELNATAQRRVAVLDPLLVEITNLPDDINKFDFTMSNLPGNEAAGKRPLPFSKHIYIERGDFMLEPQGKFHRLKPDGEVRLMNAFLMRCQEVIIDNNGEVEKLRCTVDLETSNGMPVDGRKVKGTIHWISVDHAVDAELRLFSHLFTPENATNELNDDNLAELINPESRIVVPTAKVEPCVATANVGERFQFVRTGYFTKDSKDDGIFNRIAPLKSGYKPT
ncbi:MAG: glutamine--tRNA ligase/YqeY domain fusion protein [Oscillospiraceae bacterium]|nr:glutamine--tRNA ligase/YqeY domain fusion protein [Oscillospiraceae bacterium]